MKWNCRLPQPRSLWLLGPLLFLIHCTSVKTPLRKPPVTPPETGEAFVIPALFPREDALAPALASLEIAPDDPSLWQAVGLLYQRLSPPDRMDYVYAAGKHLEQAQNLAPEDPLTRFYLGLTYTAMGRDTSKAPLTRLQKAQKGFRLLDQVVQTLPDNPSFRILRTRVSIFAPDLLGRNNAIANDISWLQDRLSKKANWPDHVIAAANLTLGDYLQLKRKDSTAAQSHWQLAKKWGLGNEYSILAQKRLDGQPPTYE